MKKPISEYTETDIRIYMLVLKRERAQYKLGTPIYNEKDEELLTCERELIARLKLEEKTNATR